MCPAVAQVFRGAQAGGAGVVEACEVEGNGAGLVCSDGGDLALARNRVGPHPEVRRRA